MKIVLFHPVVLPPRDYGGVERVVLWLASGLREYGHEVWIAAREGSRLPEGVQLVEMPSKRLSAIDLIERLPPGTDLVHFHAPPEREFFERCSLPSVTTIHGNGKPGERFPANSVFLSRDHAERHGRKLFVYNGVDPTEFRFRVSGADSGPLFLSKTSWKVKNLNAALDVARTSKRKLSIAGGHRPWSLRFRALLEGHRWIGPVAGEPKAKALAEASALLFPVRWPEPFGLVMVEAMLSGTPVVGSKIGSIPEVVGAHGGVVVDAPFWEKADTRGREEGLMRWVEALSEAEKIDRGAVREDALQRFSHLRMTEGYLDVYKKVIRGEAL